jgi:hypothetical protein
MMSFWINAETLWYFFAISLALSIASGDNEKEIILTFGAMSLDFDNAKIIRINKKSSKFYKSY